MQKRKTCFAGIAMIPALVALAGEAQAAITTYTNAAVYTTVAGPGAYVENYSSMGEGGPQGSPTFTGGTPSVSYSVSGPGDLYRNPDTGYGTSLTTYDVGTMTITFTGGNVLAAGGTFFLTDINGVAIEGTLTVSVNGGTPITITSVATGTLPFLGFTADGGDVITTIALGSPSNGWATMTAFSASAVPEPGSMMLGIAGLAVFLRRRRN